MTLGPDLDHLVSLLMSGTSTGSHQHRQEGEQQLQEDLIKQCD